MHELLGPVLRLFHVLRCSCFNNKFEGRVERALPYLSPNLQHVLECHACGSQLALEQHDNVAVVLINLFSFGSPGRLLCVLLLDMSLKGGNLLVDSSNILLNYVCEFLSLWSLLEDSPTKESFAYANLHRTIVEQGLPFSNL